MELVFKTLTVEYFRTFGKTQTFNLSPSPGLWFLRGRNEVEPQLSSNGAGKSSAIEALCWLITGRTSRGLRNPDIKPWSGKGTPTVELALLCDGEPTTIKRTATTNGLSINDKEVGPEEAIKLLGLPFELFTNTVFYPQGQPLFFDRTPKEKMELFAAALQLDRWEDRSTRASAKVKELERLEAEIVGELTSTRETLAQTEKLVERAKASSEEWDHERRAREAGAEAEIKTLERQLVKQEDELGKVDLAHDGAWVRLREMREDADKLQKVVDAARKAVDVEDFAIAADERDIRRLKQELKALGETDACPTCGQAVTGTSFGKHKAEIKRQIKTLETRVENGVSKEAAEAHKKATDILIHFGTTLHKTEDETDKLQTKLNFLKPAVEGARSKLFTLQNMRQERERERNPYLEQLQGLRKLRAQHTATLETSEKDLRKAQRQVERTKFWIKGFRDVALFLIEEALQELEAVTNSLLSEVGLIGWSVTYSVERETKSGTTQRGINVTISQPGGKGLPVRWECWSGGEGQRIRLVGAMALSDVLLRHAGISTNLEIFDEPTTHLSPAGVDDLCSYLAERAKASTKTVWVIDHMAREGGHFAGTVTITKTKAGSIIS